MTRTCTAQTETRSAVVFLELVVAIVIISLTTTLAIFAVDGKIGTSQFERQARAFINTLVMARDAAAHSNRRYAVILDFVEKKYTLRQFASLDLQTIPEDEAIIATANFSEHCQLDYVLFDDFADTRREGENITEARLYAGHSGWQYGAKIVLRNADGNPYSVIINRISRVIELKPGDVDILVPVENVPF